MIGWNGDPLRIEQEIMKKIVNTTKWYIHTLESILENKTLKILWNFDVTMDHLKT